MKLSRLWPLLIYSVCSVTYVSSSRAEEPCTLASSLSKYTAETWGLSYKKAVPCEVANQSEVRSYLEHLLFEKTPALRLQSEAFFSKFIGMVPEDFDYERGLINLYLGQIGAYYDPERKTFVMVDWIAGEAQAPLVVHELTHALQDQYYDLDAMVDPKIENSDLVLAHSALVEGDATIVATKYENPAGAISFQCPKTFPPLLENGVPRSLKVIATFPYEFGPKFVLNQDRQKLLSHPPSSTREILHLEHTGFKPQKFTEDEMVGERTGEILYRETFGELELVALLSMFDERRDVVEKAAAGWKGDRLLLLGPNPKEATDITWWLSWESNAEAKEFIEMFKPALEKHRDKMLSFECGQQSDFGDGWSMKACLQDTVLKFSWQRAKKRRVRDFES